MDQSVPILGMGGFSLGGHIGGNVHGLVFVDIGSIGYSFLSSLYPPRVVHCWTSMDHPPVGLCWNLLLLEILGTLVVEESNEMTKRIQ